MRVLLLGASGFLGHNVLSQLLAAHYEVVLLLRDGAVVDPTLSGYERISGSLLNDSDLLRAVTGCSAIINCAGVTDMSLCRLSDYRPVNRDLCRRLVAVMEQEAITTLVHVSTANTIGYGSPDADASEDAAWQDPFSRSLYARSKREGEIILQEAASRHRDWHVVMVNPGFIIGPYDVKPSSGRLLLAAYRRRWMAVPRGGKSFVSAKDVAVAVVNALTMGRSGHRYLATGENLSLRDFYHLQAVRCGYRQRCVVLPNSVVQVAGWVGDVLRLCGVATSLSSCNVRQLMVREYYCNAAARDALQMPQHPIGEAIEEFFLWRQQRDV